MAEESTPKKGSWGVPLLMFVLGIVLALLVVGMLNIFGLFNYEGIELSGNIVTEEREVSDFDQISLSGVGNLIITQGEEEGLTVEADENLMEIIITEVVNDKLEIKYKKQGLFGVFGFVNLFTDDINFRVSVKDLESINISGSGSAISDNIVTDDLSITISGSADIDMNVEVDNLTTKTSGSGNLTITGTADRQEVKISGSGKYYGQDLVSREADINTSGSARVEVDVSEKLDVSISGSGSVYYTGDASIGKSSISGSGKIEKRD